MIPNFAAYRLGCAETVLIRCRREASEGPELQVGTYAAVGAYASCYRDALKQCPEVARASLETVRAWPATWALLPDDVRGSV